MNASFGNRGKIIIYGTEGERRKQRMGCARCEERRLERETKNRGEKKKKKR